VYDICLIWQWNLIEESWKENLKFIIRPISKVITEPKCRSWLWLESRIFAGALPGVGFSTNIGSGAGGGVKVSVFTVQFISPSRPSTECFRNAGTGGDGEPLPPHPAASSTRPAQDSEALFAALRLRVTFFCYAWPTSPIKHCLCTLHQ